MAVMAIIKKKCGAPYICGGARRTARPPKLMGAHGYRLQHGGGKRCVALIEEVTEMCRWMIKKYIEESLKYTCFGCVWNRVHSGASLASISLF